MMNWLQIERGDAIEIRPGACGAADAAIDHQLVRMLGHLGVEVVHQHAQRRLRDPALGGDLGAGRGEDVAGIVSRVVHGSPPVRPA